MSKQFRLKITLDGAGHTPEPSPHEVIFFQGLYTLSDEQIADVLSEARADFETGVFDGIFEVHLDEMLRDIHGKDYRRPDHETLIREQPDAVIASMIAGRVPWPLSDGFRNENPFLTKEEADFKGEEDLSDMFGWTCRPIAPGSLEESNKA